MRSVRPQADAEAGRFETGLRPVGLTSGDASRARLGDVPAFLDPAAYELVTRSCRIVLVGRDQSDHSAVRDGVSTRPWIVDDDLWALIEPLLPPSPERSPGPRLVSDRLCLQGILFVLHQAIPALGVEVRLRADVLASPGPVAEGRSLRSVAPSPAHRAECGWRTRLVTCVRGRLPHPRKKGGPDTGPSPVDRRKTCSKHHLICDGRGTPLKVITTAANVNDVTQTLALVDGIPPVAGRPDRPRRRPDALLGDKGYDSNPNRDALRKRRSCLSSRARAARTSKSPWPAA
ncbi:transposase [Streptomyces halstedii]|uniref:transposase n=1 Tax=Streptomyces halstedii TaxID=1944 RepID=UPI0036808746